MNVRDEDYKNGYRKLYGWLRTKHPEILQEYRKDCLADKKKADLILIEATEK